MELETSPLCSRCGERAGVYYHSELLWPGGPICVTCLRELDLCKRRMTPKKYLGPGPTGLFLFAALPEDVQAFSSLEEAVQELGGAITFPENLPEVSPRVHAGYNDGLRRSYSPRTDATDGAPRTLTLQEQMEYDKGYIEGLGLRGDSKK